MGVEEILVRKIVTFALVVLASTALACGAGSDDADDTAGPGAQAQGGGALSSPEAAADGHTVVLEVTGAKKADITYGLGADQSQEQGAKVPWKKTLTSKEDFLIPTVVAQNKGSGTITCRITVDGKLAKENKSKGQYAVVTCTADAL
jgi:hypothetical protein